MRQVFPVPADSATDVDLDAAYAHGPGVVRANMVESIDGAATIEGRSGGLSGEADKALFALLRRHCDAVLVGASTVRQENYGPAKRTPIVVVTKSLDLDPQARFFQDPPHRPVIVTTDDSDPLRRSALDAVADVVIAGTGRVDMGLALDLLAERGLTRVLSEGGPALLAEIAAADRLDELCLTLAPYVVGGHSKRIVDGALHDPPARMSLIHVLEDEGFLFLRYRRDH